VAFLGPAAAGLPRQVLPVSSIAALATLGIVNAGRRLLAVLPADRRGRAATASVITYVMPVVALFLGVSLCGERLTAGLILIALDAWLGTSRHPR
jgi:drug/metabolite transporter (DMT)-like permease